MRLHGHTGGCSGDCFVLEITCHDYFNLYFQRDSYIAAAVTEEAKVPKAELTDESSSVNLREVRVNDSLNYFSSCLKQTIYFEM